MQLREMNYDELMAIDGGQGVWETIGEFFTGLADGFMEWFFAI